MNSDHPKLSQSVFTYAGEGLLRLDATGVYYARFKFGGKQFKKSLKTTDKAHAKRLLREYRADVENLNSKEAGRVTFDAIAQRWLDSIRGTVKPNTLLRRKSCVRNLEPYFRTVTLAGLTAQHCENWKTKRGDQIAPQTFAHELGTMKAVFEYAIAHGILWRNPARGIKRRRIIATREKRIPSRDQFAQIIAAIRQSDGRKKSQVAAKAGANFVELLAYSGMRKHEAAAVLWREVDFDKGLLTVSGGKQGTKNSETRTVPLGRELRELLLRLHRDRKPAPAPSDTVAQIADPKKCLATAARKLDLSYFSPHRFRDFFATTCVEAGTDIPTVARWMGHKDGGALLMKTYAHLRQEHSKAAMDKITFGANPFPKGSLKKHLTSKRDRELLARLSATAKPKKPTL